MKKLFLTYELSKLCKDNGFKDDCFGYYVGQKFILDSDKKSFINARTNAPLYQQCIDWLLETHNIYVYINPFPYENKVQYHVTYRDENGDWCDVHFNSLDEAIENSVKEI